MLKIQKKMNLKNIEKEIDKRTMSKKELAIEKLKSILSSSPSVITNLVTESYYQMRIPKEYLFSSTLNAVGNSIGLKVGINALGFTNYPNINSVIVGSRGDAKSIAMNIAFSPLKKYDSKAYNNYKEEVEGLTELERAVVHRRRLLIKRGSFEGALDTHVHNPDSNGILLGEITGFIQNMNNPNSRDGEKWLTYLLDGFTNEYDDNVLKTSESHRLDKTFPMIIGSVQNQLVSVVFSKNNLFSGLIDRFQFTNQLESYDKVTKGNVSKEVRDIYKHFIDRILALREQEGTFYLNLNTEAESLLIKYLQSLVDESKIIASPMKEYIAKLEIYIHKLIIIVHVINSLSKGRSLPKEVSVDDVKLAIEINDFYKLNFEILLDFIDFESSDTSIKDVVKYAKTNGLKQKDVVEFTGKDKSNINREWKKV